MKESRREGECTKMTSRGEKPSRQERKKRIRKPDKKIKIKLTKKRWGTRKMTMPPWQRCDSVIRFEEREFWGLQVSRSVYTLTVKLSSSFDWGIERKSVDTSEKKKKEEKQHRKMWKHRQKTIDVTWKGWRKQKWKYYVGNQRVSSTAKVPDTLPELKHSEFRCQGGLWDRI